MADPQDLFWLVRHGAPAHLYPWLLEFIEALVSDLGDTIFCFKIVKVNRHK